NPIPKEMPLPAAPKLKKFDNLNVDTVKGRLPAGSLVSHTVSMIAQELASFVSQFRLTFVCAPRALGPMELYR
ncbi:MAG: hypothetical protein ACRECV_18680, partial [Xanthobacteraceae bacterium]